MKLSTKGANINLNGNIRLRNSLLFLAFALILSPEPSEFNSLLIPLNFLKFRGNYFAGPPRKQTESGGMKFRSLEYRLAWC